jgi:hypothetical protein
VSRPFRWWVLALLPAGWLLHQNFWMWRDDALVLGVPVNFLYHIVLSLGFAAIMLAVVKRAWPDYLDRE